MFKKLHPTIFFDAIGSGVTNEIIERMPMGTVTYNYGTLGMDSIHVTPMTLIYRQHTLKGMWLNWYLLKSGRSVEIFTNALKNLGDGTFKTEIGGRFTFHQIHEALESSNTNATKGKVLVQNPNF